jgi:hypothetical protein
MARRWGILALSYSNQLSVPRCISLLAINRSIIQTSKLHIAEELCYYRGL